VSGDAIRYLQADYLLKESQMENISQLVDDSLARHGVQPAFDHLRLQWSRWFRCESSFSVLLAPAKPGIFALGEEIIPTGESMELRSPIGKRMLGLFQISETDDLGMTLGRLFLPGNPLRERLTSARCFARYSVIEDSAQRTAAHAVFYRWMQQSAETASGIGSGGFDPCGAGALAREFADRKSVPSASFAWSMEVQNQESPVVKVRPAPLPAGF